MTKCRHPWCNIDGCLLCGKNWDELKTEGYYFDAVKAPIIEENQ